MAVSVQWDYTAPLPWNQNQAHTHTQKKFEQTTPTWYGCSSEPARCSRDCSWCGDLRRRWRGQDRVASEPRADLHATCFKTSPPHETPQVVWDMALGIVSQESSDVWLLPRPSSVVLRSKCFINRSLTTRMIDHQLGFNGNFSTK